MGGYVLCDDTVPDKSHRHNIAPGRRQPSGNAHGLGHRPGELRVRQSPILTSAGCGPTACSPPPDGDGKDKNGPLKRNHLVDDSGGQQPCQPLALLTWSARHVAHGKRIKVKKMPNKVKVKRFRVLMFPHRTDYLVTNELAPDDPAAAEQESNVCWRSVRWRSEQLHREAKQLTGLWACQCRLARSQRTHPARALRAWACLKRVACPTKTSVYQLKQGPLDYYLRRELAPLTLPFVEVLCY